MDAETPGQLFEISVTDAERDQHVLFPETLRLATLLLHTRGYVILRGGMPVQIAEEAAERFRQIHADCMASREGDGWWQVGHQTKAVFWERNHRWRIFPKLTGAFANEWILANPFALQILEQLLGEGIYCKFVSSDTCMKGTTLQSPHREMGGGNTWEAQSFIVNVPLGVCGLHNGPLEVWPGGSHLWRNELLRRLEVNDDVQDGRNPEFEWFATLFPSRKVELFPGDLLIRDPGLMHRGTVNESEQPRSMLTISYFREGFTHDYGNPEHNLDRELWEMLEPRVKRLFAYVFEGGVPTVRPPSTSPQMTDAQVSPLWED
ncbi:phytanoyl-CoA dioxygenase PhyH [Roseimicrobium gellanilyticum]|uniref:Phytanoyl-CoA dioxygenase PhyH n=1 Tax=Roseimicrobium gellanilyticum TaxID=748857 RepID=A0A366HNT0_9BACT|nr:phytanoyl-CoA dioxygenase family protein [Roseimicrobium gellanilyticum]RBP43891.1 phytanoyl-CoA dioxygenase PhyH [Roseimicrobium gellanilyticum]